MALERITGSEPPGGYVAGGLKVPAVEPLGQPGTARSVSVTGTSASATLTTTVRRVSIRAVGADIRYRVGTGAQTAVGTDHFIADGERLDIAVPASAVIAAIRNASTSGTLEITELT